MMPSPFWNIIRRKKSPALTCAEEQLQEQLEV